MSIRTKALQWYKVKYGRLDIPIYSSKYYQPDESWPGMSVWWPQIPVKAITEYTHIHILCERFPGANDFFHLKIPTQFLRDHQEQFHIIGEKIMDFYFSADPERLFKEERGTADLDFKKFLVNET